MGKSESAPLWWEAELIWVRRTLNKVETFVSEWDISALHFLTCAVTCIILSIYISDFFAGVGQCTLAHTNTQLT